MTDEVSTYQGEGVNQAGDPKHIHEMVAKMEDPVEVSDGGFSDEQPLPTQSDNNRPDWLPEKFNSAEDMARAYKQLESKFSQNQEQQQQSEENERFQKEEVPSIHETSPSQVNQILSDRGLDFSVFQQEYNETGTLSPEAIKSLEEEGISEQVVATWIEGQEAMAENQINSIYENVGGEISYNQMMEWATDNLQTWEVEAFNSQVENLDANSHLAVLGLHARYQNAEGGLPSLIAGASTGDIASRYDSLAQVTEAMSNPKYTSDPAYRAKVAQRLNNSSVL